jgi:hypothetical protein
MRTKSLVLFRSKSISFKEGKMEKAPVLDPRTVWEPSTVAEEQIQALADRGLVRPKTEVGWRPAAGEEFPMEGTGKIVGFLTHIERGFGVPAGDFLRGLLFFYRSFLPLFTSRGLPRHHAAFPPVAPLLRAEEDRQGRGCRKAGVSTTCGT